MNEQDCAVPSRPFLPPADACRYIKENWGITTAESTLAKLRVNGEGPPFVKFGRKPLYPPDGIDQWAAEKIGRPRSSTSDQPAEASSGA